MPEETYNFFGLAKKTENNTIQTSDGLFWQINTDGTYTQVVSPQSKAVMPFKPTGIPYVPIWGEATPNKKDKTYRGRTLGVVKRPEGIRFYLGKGAHKNPEQALTASEIDLEQKVTKSPADSVRAENVRKILERRDYDRALRLLKTNPDYIGQNKL